MCARASTCCVKMVANKYQHSACCTRPCAVHHLKAGTLLCCVHLLAPQDVEKGWKGLIQQAEAPSSGAPQAMAPQGAGPYAVILGISLVLPLMPLMI